MLLSASEILTRTWKIFTAHFTDIAQFMVILGLLYAGLEGLKIVSLTAIFTGSIPLVYAVFFLAIIIAALIGFWLSLVLIKSLGEAVQNQKVEGIISSLKSTAPFYFSALGVSIFVGFITFFGALFLIIPGIIFAVWYFFSVHTVIFDRKTIIEGIKTSKALVVGRWWSVLWRLVVPQLVFVIAAVLFQTVFELPFGFMEASSLGYKITGIAIAALSAAAFLPLSTIAILVLYFNLRENAIVQEPNLLQK